MAPFTICYSKSLKKKTGITLNFYLKNTLIYVIIKLMPLIDQHSKMNVHTCCSSYRDCHRECIEIH